MARISCQMQMMDERTAVGAARTRGPASHMLHHSLSAHEQNSKKYPCIYQLVILLSANLIFIAIICLSTRPSALLSITNAHQGFQTCPIGSLVTSSSSSFIKVDTPN